MNNQQARAALDRMAQSLGLDAASELARLTPSAYKARDPREPGARAKTQAEKKLFSILARFFAEQAARLKRQIEWQVPYEKKADPFGLGDDYWDKENEIMRGVLIDFLTQSAREGVGINDAWTREKFGIIVDPTLTNGKASNWARKYAAQLVKAINDTTRKSIRDNVATWIQTPGATIGDLVAQLPFDEQRALRIAVTEVTQAYAEGERLYTQELQDRYPTLQIVRVWYTNNDDRVCPVCAPLDGKEIPVDGGWGENGKNDPAGLQGPPAHPGCRCWTGRDVNV